MFRQIDILLTAKRRIIFVKRPFGKIERRFVRAKRRFFSSILKSRFFEVKKQQKTRVKTAKKSEKASLQTNSENLYSAFYPTNFPLNRTKNAEFLLQNRKTFVTLLREFCFSGDENKLYLFPL